jgi:hypothetical protein
MNQDPRENQKDERIGESKNDAELGNGEFLPAPDRVEILEGCSSGKAER